MLIATLGAVAAAARPILLIHIPKTGGDSVREALGLGCPNTSSTGCEDYEDTDPAPECLDVLHVEHVHPKHDSVTEARSYYTQAAWDEAYKIAFVRNPWDRAVSDYIWQDERVLNDPSYTLECCAGAEAGALNSLQPLDVPGNSSYCSLEQVVRNGCIESLKMENAPYMLKMLEPAGMTWSDGFQPVESGIDFVGRMENLTLHLREALIAAGNDEALATACAASLGDDDHNSSHGSYEEYFPSKALIEHPVFTMDAAAFNYTFNASAPADVFFQRADTSLGSHAAKAAWARCPNSSLTDEELWPDLEDPTEGNPMACNLSLPASCGQDRQRGVCSPISTLLGDSRWSQLDARADPRVSCFWMAREMVEAQRAGRDDAGLCACTGNFDGVGCAGCRRGWTGENCSSRYEVVRKSVADLSTEETHDFRVALFAQEPGMKWLHSTVIDVGDVANGCVAPAGAVRMWAGAAEAPTNPHYDPWLLQWHKLYIAVAEREVIQNTSLTGYPYWDLEAGSLAAAQLVYDAEPSLSAPGCPVIPIPPNVQSVVSGLTNAPITWPEQEAAIAKLHAGVHTWFCASGYVECNWHLNDTRESAITQLLPNISTAELTACLEADGLPIYEFIQAADSPFFWALHVYLDNLFERWQQAWGYGPACSEKQGLAEVTSDGVQANTAPPHPDACISQMVFERANYSYRDMCRPSAEWGIRYV